MLDNVKLATLRAVLEHGSFSAAAQSLSLTQPAVSRQVSLLERQLGTQLVRRTQQGVHATEAGRLLAEHAQAILSRVALAEGQLAEIAGLRAGHVRLGSFLSALVHLSAGLSARLEAVHPELFRAQHQVISDELVDRTAAFTRLAGGELDLAIVFEHSFEPSPAPDGIELVTLFSDPACVLLPARHPLAGAGPLALAELAHETWIAAHHGSAARFIAGALERAQLYPQLVRAGHGDEPIEAQALIAAGQGITLAHRLNVIIDPRRIAVVALAAGQAPERKVQAALMRGHRAPATLAALDALEWLAGERRAADGQRDAQA
jgi:DNA-binding transcriptional LysR family regulator